MVNNDKDDNDRDRKNGGCYETKEKDETNFRCVIYGVEFISRITLTDHYNKHKRDKLFKAPSNTLNINGTRSTL